MHGAKRVIVFCIMTTILPTILITIPLYLRHVVFADVTYELAESDVIEIKNGISSVFCSAHSLEMNKSFNAIQLSQTPIVSTKRKHIRLKKSMTLPDDTLEYWGFYLLKGATVNLKVCSRYEGSRILVVRGERNLRTCGLMEHNLKKFGATLDQEHNQVKVTFESAQEIEDFNISKESNYHIRPPKSESIVNAAVEDISDNDDIKFIIDSRLNKSYKSGKLNMESTALPKTFLQDNKTSNSHLRKFPSYKQAKSNKKHKNRNRHRSKKQLQRKKQLFLDLQSDNELQESKNVSKRDVTSHLLDTKIEHGGNAINYTGTDSNENSVSSFETGLLTCYNGQILLTEAFPPSHLCTDVHYLETADRMETIHNVVSDGYYYYIFYSDNDFIKNDIHAIFDIHKPTLKFTNTSQSKSCINKTFCKFPILFWSSETVIVEIPMEDGIEHDGDDVVTLVSTCHPRMSIYIFFPVTVMFLILGCAFM